MAIRTLQHNTRISVTPSSTETEPFYFDDVEPRGTLRGKLKAPTCDLSTQLSRDVYGPLFKDPCIGDGTTGKVGGAHDDGRAQQMCR